MNDVPSVRVFELRTPRPPSSECSRGIGEWPLRGAVPPDVFEYFITRIYYWSGVVTEALENCIIITSVFLTAISTEISCWDKSIGILSPHAT